MNRPRTLQEIARSAESWADFGPYFQDWLHTVRTFSSRGQLAEAIAAEPRRLSRVFTEGKIADAWLAAYAEYAAQRIGIEAPAWTQSRKASEPWFAVEGTDVRSRLAALRDSPGPFKSRNLFTPTVDLPLRLRPGRPAKDAAELRQANAARQRAFRERRRRELRNLRKIARR